MNWKKIGIVMGREFSIRVKKKSFLLITIFAPLLMAALIVAPTLLMVNTKGSKQKIAVLDESNWVMPYLENTDILQFTPVSGPLDSLKQHFAKMDVDALLNISAMDSTGMLSVAAWSEKDLNVEARSYVNGRIEQALRDYRIQSYNIENIEAILADLNPRIQMKTYLFSQDTGEEKESFVEMNMAISYITSLLIYMFVFMFGNMVMRSVIDEKSSRIVEVIVSSVKPFDLMIGKIFGVAAVALTQFAIWIVLTIALVIGGQFLVGKSLLEDMDPAQLAQISATGGNEVMAALQTTEMGGIFQSIMQIDFSYILGCFFLYFVLGYLLYAAMFAAIGSAVENEADTQMLVLPITAPLMVGLFIMMHTFQYPDSTLSVWASIIPFTSPMVMMARIPFEGGVPMVELVTSLALLLLTFLGITWISAKIYRTGILMYGKKVSFKDLWTWLKY